MENKTSSIKTLRMQALSLLPTCHSFLKFDDFACVTARIDQNFDDENQIYHDNKENAEEQQEFSFACINPQEKLIFADEIFDNGKIRPTITIFDQSLIFTTTHDNDDLSLRLPLKKLFIEKINDFSSESKVLHNEASQKTTMVEVVDSNNKCKKSNSMGFSKIWRFRKNLKLRSNSNGEDVFVSLSPLETVPMRSNKAKKENVISKKGNDEKCKVSLSAHEKLYVMNRKRKENSKRKSFLPYRHGLIGFFTNRNEFSRNLHPF